jgi:DUF1365 family protein
MKSAIFEGRVRHRRILPKQHSFQYRMFLMYLDLAELSAVFRGRWFWSVKRMAFARFRRSDHFGDQSRPLDDCMRQLVEEEAGFRPDGPIRLLTHLSYFGYCFNPVSFYYCFEHDDTALVAIVAEVNNTPWGEQHMYVLDMRGRNGERAEFKPVKAMHVSPFMPMEMDYVWRFDTPHERLHVHMENHREGRKVFDASMALQRTEISGVTLARVLLMYPLLTMKVMLAIHWQALKLWVKRVPLHDHPDKHKTLAESK